MESITQALFSAKSIWSVVFRGGIWFVIALIIIISADAPDPESSLRSLKSNLGFFLMFIFFSGVLVYLLFGFGPEAQG